MLITNLSPDPTVVAAMNGINSAKLHRQACENKAEALKALRVKLAEAECEARHLEGIGIAKQRRAIINGFEDSCMELKAKADLGASDVVHMMLLNQYLDTMKEFATNRKGGAVISHRPGNMEGIERQIASGFFDAEVDFCTILRSIALPACHCFLLRTRMMPSCVPPHDMPGATRHRRRLTC